MNLWQKIQIQVKSVNVCGGNFLLGKGWQQQEVKEEIEQILWKCWSHSCHQWTTGTLQKCLTFVNLLKLITQTILSVDIVTFKIFYLRKKFSLHTQSKSVLQISSTGDKTRQISFSTEKHFVCSHILMFDISTDAVLVQMSESRNC